MRHKDAEQRITLDFERDELPVTLHEWLNNEDSRLAYYFQLGRGYYILTIDFCELSLRENPCSARYIVSAAINKNGSKHIPHIIRDISIPDIFSCERTNELIDFLQIVSALHHRLPSH
ncbi:hypothetical protein [Salinivibrio costicola]|uniref:Uncharacterized protein n=1 Tax=Salinivibrio costicola TaxID=51367 RepID=A0ABX6KC21_SALCS|nr:hypothetical protein [Salinivibrio costicola]QIR08046.1 hypothetical protein HBA18_16590 [Salinivibrio costicola]